MRTSQLYLLKDGVAQSVEHWAANLATQVLFPVWEEPSDLIREFLDVQMESNWAGLSVCNCRHTGKWCGTLKAVGNTDHTRQTWIHMQTPLSPLARCGPVGEGTSGKVLNWTVRSLNHVYTTTKPLFILFCIVSKSYVLALQWQYKDRHTDNQSRNCVHYKSIMQKYIYQQYQNFNKTSKFGEMLSSPHQHFYPWERSRHGASLKGLFKDHAYQN